MVEFSRRAALVTAGAALLSGCSRPDDPGDGEPQLGCRVPEALADFSTVGGAPLGYEVNRSDSTLRADPQFIALLERWAEDWSAMSGLGAITRVWSYGAYVDKCPSLHAAGRAFDFAEVVHESGSVSCRYDTWGPGSPEQLRSYWRLAASLHLHFAYTLTYRYDDAHRNHIHVDNAISGNDLSTFNQGSRVQVDLVQSALSSVFGHDVAPSGEWDDPTQDALRATQQNLGIGRPLADPDGWREFLRATASAA